jgi:HEPN domain-containing protein
MNQYNKWFEHAASDLSAAISMVKNNNIDYKYACGHLHYVAEKTLKGLLIYNGVSPQYTHDLALLLQDLEQFINPLPDVAVDILVLMKFQPTSRYPAEESEIIVTKEEFSHYLKIASECLSWAKSYV